MNETNFTMNNEKNKPTERWKWRKKKEMVKDKEWTDDRTNEQTNEGTNERMNEWMNEWMNESMNE